MGGRRREAVQWVRRYFGGRIYSTCGYRRLTPLQQQCGACISADKDRAIGCACPVPVCLRCFCACSINKREEASPFCRRQPPLPPSHSTQLTQVAKQNHSSKQLQSSSSASTWSCPLFLHLYIYSSPPSLPASFSPSPPLPYHLPESIDPPPLLLPPLPRPLLLGEGVLLLLIIPPPPPPPFPPPPPPSFPPLLPSPPTSLCKEALRQSML